MFQNSALQSHVFLTVGYQAVLAPSSTIFMVQVLGGRCTKQAICTRGCPLLSGVAKMSMSQCVRNTHLLGNLGHAPAMEKYTLKLLLRSFLATNTIHSVLLVRSLHVCMKLAISHMLIPDL